MSAQALVKLPRSMFGMCRLRMVLAREEDHADEALLTDPDDDDMSDDNFSE